MAEEEEDEEERTYRLQMRDVKYTRCGDVSQEHAC
jgi:hypothetical protein